MVMQGTEFCDTAGFDVLAKRMRDGRDACRCYLDFIRQRFVSTLSIYYSKACLIV